MVFDEIRILSAGIVVSSAVIIIALERLIPYNKQQFFRDQLFSDFILYAILQSLILGVGFSYLMEAIRASPILVTFRLASEWSIAWQLIFFTCLHDLYIYFFHRFQHKSKFLWRIHEAHHSTHDVDWLSGSRSHSMEIVINQSIEFGIIALLSGNPAIPILKAAIDGVWGMYIHSNIDVRSGWLQYIINGPEMHRWHHATDTDSFNKNFSTKFAIWDWLFGTAFRPIGRKPAGYGLDDPNFPQGYIAQHLYPFRSDEKDALRKVALSTKWHKESAL